MTMKGIILYKSKYGATKQYAEWIAERTGFPCVRTEDADIRTVSEYDTVILGGGVYASGIAGLSFLKKNIGQLKGKKILVFCCGASPYEQEAFEAAVRHNMKDELAGIPCFYCRGAWDMEKMTVMDRGLCRMLQKAVAKKDPEALEVWEKALLEAGTERHDWTDRSYLAPILEEIRKTGSD
jgi:menaquinone-dependent protoporphyrinogen IX oxidase